MLPSGFEQRVSRILPLAIVATALSACALSSDYRSAAADARAADVHPLAAGEIDHTLVLVGDCGYAVDAGDPVLRIVRREAERHPARTTVLFLGDNVYPWGLREGNADDLARLRAQADAVHGTGAEALFLPGNHDYYAGGAAGMQRQQDALDAYGSARLRVAPPPGDAGPSVIDRGQRLRLVVLDSPWWVQPEDRGESDSADADPDAVLAQLRAALDSADGRELVIAAHHPLVTHGVHGGFFTWRQHLFPLTDVDDRLWVPLPVLGSLYAFARQLGVTSLDTSGSLYADYIEEMDAVLSPHRPIVYAAGHDHALQVLDGDSVRFHVVSGAGSWQRPDAVTYDDDTLLASPFAGAMRLDLLRDGRVRLQVFEIDRKGVELESFAMWLD